MAILSIIGIVLIQAALIAALLLQRRRRLRAERAVRQQRIELTHVGRLASIGELTASITHEVKQPLTSILANTEAAEQLLLTTPVDLDEIRQILAQVRRDNLRASRVIGRLPALLTKSEIALEPIDLEEVIADALQLLEPEARRRGMRITSQTDIPLPRVPGDRIHLQQVLLTLVTNAMDAIADAPSPRRPIVVHAMRRVDGVEVAVIDRGHGVAPEHIKHLFHSFFTTKERGMGLGLSIAQSIVEAHGGRIWLDPDCEDGASFSFFIPAAASAASPRPTATAGWRL